MVWCPFRHEPGRVRVRALGLVALVLSLVSAPAGAQAQSSSPWRGAVDVASVAVNAPQTAGDATSAGRALSADGRFVVFESQASNLVATDTNNTNDIFVRDRLLGTTERVSVSSAGDEANDYSWAPSITADGRFVVFTSFATNLVPDDTNGRVDVFVRDRQLGTTVRANVREDGSLPPGASDPFTPTISATGRFVGYATGQPMLAYLKDRDADGNRNTDEVRISADGRFVVFDSRTARMA